MKSATATAPTRQEPIRPKSVSEPQTKARPADQRPEPSAQGTTPSQSTVVEFESIVVDEEKIRRRAYELWVEDGYQDGNQLEHWLAAERELRGKKNRRQIILAIPHLASEIIKAADPIFS